MRPLRCLLQRPPYLFLHQPSRRRQDEVFRAGYRLLHTTEQALRKTYIYKLVG